jgi:hypothetical protein
MDRRTAADQRAPDGHAFAPVYDENWGFRSRSLPSWDYVAARHLAAPSQLFLHCQPASPNVIKPYRGLSVIRHAVAVRCQLLCDRTALCAKNYLKSRKQLVLRHGKEFFIRHLN